MKKFLCVVLFLLFICPFGVGAAGISSASMGGVSEVEAGSYFYLPIYVNFTGVGGDDSGVYTIAMNLDFDSEILIPTAVISDYYNSAIYTENGEYLILSVADEDSTGNKCKDGFLACSNYEIKVQFYVKSDSKNTTNVKVGKIAAGLFKIDPTFETYDDAHMNIAEFGAISQTIPIKNTDKTIETPKESIIHEEKAPDIKNMEIEKAVEEKKKETPSSTKSPSSEKTENQKSSNTFLSSLVIEGYPIDFKKDQLHYDISVENDVESLNIQVKTEDAKSTYQVIGAEVLKEEVKVIVQAEDGTEATYTIGISRGQQDASIINEQNDKALTKINKIALCILGGVVGIILLCFLISRHNNRKLDKILKDL